MRLYNYREFIKKRFRELLNEAFSKRKIQEERREIVQKAIPLIEDCLKKYQDCKIGKSSDVDARLDAYYTNQGFNHLIPIHTSISKVSIDRAEEDLIDYFEGRVLNDQRGGGNRAYTGKYSIYIVHKGPLSP